MSEELKEAIRNNVCDNFLKPENCNAENTKKDCMACAKDFIKGWESRSASKEVLS